MLPGCCRGVRSLGSSKAWELTLVSPCQGWNPGPRAEWCPQPPFWILMRGPWLSLTGMTQTCGLPASASPQHPLFSVSPDHSPLHPRAFRSLGRLGPRLPQPALSRARVAELILGHWLPPPKVETSVFAFSSLPACPLYWDWAWPPVRGRCVCPSCPVLPCPPCGAPRARARHSAASASPQEAVGRPGAHFRAAARGPRGQCGGCGEQRSAGQGQGAVLHWDQDQPEHEGGCTWLQAGGVGPR